ncbi:hypothetical protein Bca101_082755 [Brassica carinata]
MGLRIYEIMFMNMFQPKERKTQQDSTFHGRTIYQSDGNSETDDHAKGHDQPKIFATTTFKIQSKVFVFGQVHLIYLVCIF